MDFSDEALLREAKLLAKKLSDAVPKIAPEGRLKVGRESPYGTYVDIAKIRNGGVIEIWLASEAGRSLFWVGLFFDDWVELESALKKSAVIVPKDRIVKFGPHEDNKYPEENLFDTVIESYDYADEYFVGRYFESYLVEDATSYLLMLLGKERVTEETYSLSPEIASAIGEADQGRGLTAKQRKAVELRAMKVAANWLAGAGYKARDVSGRESWDFSALKDGVEWIVEVKGTTAEDANKILLTKNEVGVHHKRHPNNMLLIVQGIRLSDDQASGGNLAAFIPWVLAEERLTPICFSYRLKE